MTPQKDTILGLLLIQRFVQVTCKLCFARHTGEEAVSGFYLNHLPNPSGEFYFIPTMVIFLLVGDSKHAGRKIPSALVTALISMRVHNLEFDVSCRRVPGHHISLQIKNTPIRSVIS
jgi:hypothetical protein